MLKERKDNDEKRQTREIEKMRQREKWIQPVITIREYRRQPALDSQETKKNQAHAKSAETRKNNNTTVRDNIPPTSDAKWNVSVWSHAKCKCRSSRSSINSHFSVGTFDYSAWINIDHEGLLWMAMMLESTVANSAHCCSVLLLKLLVLGPRAVPLLPVLLLLLLVGHWFRPSVISSSALLTTTDVCDDDGSFLFSSAFLLYCFEDEMIRRGINV